MGMFSWQMASSTLEQSATSWGMTQPSPGAKAAAPPRLRAPSTGSKVKPSHRPPMGWPRSPGEGHCPPAGPENRVRLFGIPGLTLRSLPAPTDPAFVASAYIPESLGSLEGDDDKIYFFFSETGQEFEFFENTIVSRIARICKGDEGGGRILQQRWTSFLKAQLLCLRPDDSFPFNVLQDVFTLSPSPQDWRDTLFYGVFTSQW